MGQHAQRFDAVGAQRGTGLASVVGQLKTVADTVEEWFDPNSPEVISAMQRFEQGLALLARAPKHPESGEPAKAKKTRGRAKSSKKDADASDSDDAPTNTAEGQGAVEGS